MFQIVAHDLREQGTALSATHIVLAKKLAGKLLNKNFEVLFFFWYKFFYWKFKTHTKIANKNNSIIKFTE